MFEVRDADLDVVKLFKKKKLNHHSLEVFDDDEDDESIREEISSEEIFGKFSFFSSFCL